MPADPLKSFDSLVALFNQGEVRAIRESHPEWIAALNGDEEAISTLTSPTCMELRDLSIAIHPENMHPIIELLVRYGSQNLEVRSQDNRTMIFLAGVSYEMMVQFLTSIGVSVDSWNDSDSLLAVICLGHKLFAHMLHAIFGLVIGPNLEVPEVTDDTILDIRHQLYFSRPLLSVLLNAL